MTQTGCPKNILRLDELTGLANGRLFNQTLDKYIVQPKDKMDHLAVVNLNIDRLSLINDTLGYVAGDEILIELGRRLLAWHLVHPYTFVSRFGGDEFALLIVNQDPDRFNILLQEIQDQFNLPFATVDNEIFLSGKMGVAMYPRDGTTTNELIQCADIAKNQAKKLGMKIQFFNLEFQKQINREMLIGKELYKALNEEAFQLYYQPKVDCKTGKVTGVEALLRWEHPTLGSISPTEFIPIAEQNKFIVPFGEWVMRNAIQQGVEWHKSGYTDLCVSVNISPRQLNEKMFIPDLSAMLSEYGLPAEYLETEITENVAINNEKDMALKLQAIKKLGIKLAIDDFGSGYSSLNYLREFKADILKIDQSFIIDSEVQDESWSLIPVIILMGHVLNMKVVAEGVETFEQADFLKKQGCDVIQGYYYAKPAPPEVIEPMFSKVFL